MTAQTPLTPADVADIAPEALHVAWLRLRRPTWPDTLQQAMLDPLLGRMVATAARHPAPAQPLEPPPADAPARPAPAAPSGQRGPMRLKRRFTALPPGAIDQKRAACGDSG